MPAFLIAAEMPIKKTKGNKIPPLTMANVTNLQQ